MIPEKNLVPAEKKVLAAFRAGDPEVPAEGEVRGDFLRYLFLGGYDEKTDYRGTRIVGAVVSDVLDMEFCETRFPVRFHGCSFAQEIKLQQLTCPELGFSGCALKEGLDAEMAKVAGNVFLNTVDSKEEFKAEGEVSLAGADIGGQLVCTGGSFQNEREDALNAHNITVAGDVLLDERFNAVGIVNFTGAKIGARLWCSRGSFQNKGNYALVAHNINVAADVMLNKGFNAKGPVHFSGAEIGGQLVCSSGCFQNGGNDALMAQNIKVAEDVLLNTGFDAKGTVSFSGANIRGDVSLGKFLEDKNPDNDRDPPKRKFVAEGEVRFLGAHIGGDLVLSDCKLTHLSLKGVNVSGAFRDDITAYKEGVKLDIDGFRYQRLALTDGSGELKDEDEVGRKYRTLRRVLVWVGLMKQESDSENSTGSGMTRLEWAGLMSKGDKKFRPQPYEQLMQVYRAAGHTNWARDVGFKLEKKRQQTMKSRCWKGWYWVLRLTIGYGYRPFRALYWFIPLIVAGFVLFSGKFPCPDPCRAVSEPCYCMAPSDAEVLLSEDWKIYGKLPKSYPDFNPYYYAVEAALPVLPLGQTENWHPKAQWIGRVQGVITIIGALVLTILASYGVGVLGPRWKNE